MACFENRFLIKGRPKAELLTVGTELVRGSVVNTNAAYLGQELTKLGFDVHAQSACVDDAVEIKNSLRVALNRSDIILVSGGLGPTPDDITRDAIADYFHTSLVFSQKQFNLIRRYYQKKNKTVPDIVRREARLPAIAKPVLNQFGIALGFLIEKKGCILIALPGVPAELVRLFEHHVKPYFQKKFSGLKPASVLITKTVGLSEPAIMQKLGPSFFKIGGGAFQFGIYPETGQVELRIYSDSKQTSRHLKQHIERKLGPHIYSFSDESLETVIARSFSKRRWTISVAESCTGGRIAGALTKTPGASAYFSGGVVAYGDQIKKQVLLIPSQIIKRYGAVSKQTAAAMAHQTRIQFKTKLGLGITGVAGPSGGSPRKPVGLVYIAISSANDSKVWEEHFVGDRCQIQERASKKALEYLWRWIF